MLDQLRPLAESTFDVAMPKRAAMPEIVSPLTIVYLFVVSTTGAVAAGAVPGSLRTWPGKISDFQPRPLRARTDAVDSP